MNEAPPHAMSLADARTMLQVRSADVREIEELYRGHILPDLRPRTGRSEDLFRLLGTGVGEALYLCHALQRSLDVSGDVCEFGVAQGATSRLLAREMMADPRAAGRSLWLFDSFAGLPAPGPSDRLIDDIFGLGSMEAYRGTMSCPREEVEGKLRNAGFPAGRTRIKPGWVERTLAEPPLPDRVCLAYVDFDFHDPIRTALEWLDGRMDPGATIVVDDYGFFSEGAQIAVDRFVESRRDRWSLGFPVASAGKFVVLTRRDVASGPA